MSMPLHLVNDPHFDESEEDYDETEVVVRFSLETNKIRSRVEIAIPTGYERGEWVDMSDQEKDKAMLEVFLERAIFSLGAWDWNEVSD